MDCQRIEDDEIPLRYLAGDLEEPDREDFERHFFECPSCWRRLQAVEALRDVLEVDRATRRAEARPRPSRVRPWVWAWAAGLVVAAVGVGIVLRSTPRTAVVEVRLDSNLLADLARVDPPRYIPTTLRSGAEAPLPGFAESMELYARQDYAGAARGLRAVAAQRADAAEVRFFLGLSELLAREIEAAIADLRAVVDLGHPLYSGTARFYLAKAWLRRGDPAAARAELETVARTGGSLAGEARRIMKTLEEIERRP